jgi:hypothetical protein
MDPGKGLPGGPSTARGVATTPSPTGSEGSPAGPESLDVDDDHMSMSGSMAGDSTSWGNEAANELEDLERTIQEHQNWESTEWVEEEKEEEEEEDEEEELMLRSLRSPRSRAKRAGFWDVSGDGK